MEKRPGDPGSAKPDEAPEVKAIVCATCVEEAESEDAALQSTRTFVYVQDGKLWIWCCIHDKLIIRFDMPQKELDRIESAAKYRAMFGPTVH